MLYVGLRGKAVPQVTTHWHTACIAWSAGATPSPASGRRQRHAAPPPAACSAAKAEGSRWGEAPLAGDSPEGLEQLLNLSAQSVHPRRGVGKLGRCAAAGRGPSPLLGSLSLGLRRRAPEPGNLCPLFSRPVLKPFHPPVRRCDGPKEAEAPCLRLGQLRRHLLRRDRPCTACTSSKQDGGGRLQQRRRKRARAGRKAGSETKRASSSGG